jgi:hypothetical protein
MNVDFLRKVRFTLVLYLLNHKMHNVSLLYICIW